MVISFCLKSDQRQSLNISTGNPMAEQAGIEYMAEICREMTDGTLNPRYEDLVDIRFLKDLLG